MALWNSDTWQPGGLEFEVMDMLYHLPFRDWMELNKSPAESIAAADTTSRQRRQPGHGPLAPRLRTLRS